MNNRKVTAKPGNKDVDVAKATEALPEVTEELISLDEYITRNKPHRGLVASFTYEAKQAEKGLAPRSEVDWKDAFEAQSTRIYKSFQ